MKRTIALVLLLLIAVAIIGIQQTKISSLTKQVQAQTQETQDLKSEAAKSTTSQPGAPKLTLVSANCGIEGLPCFMLNMSGEGIDSIFLVADQVSPECNQATMLNMPDMTSIGQTTVALKELSGCPFTKARVFWIRR